MLNEVVPDPINVQPDAVILYCMVYAPAALADTLMAPVAASMLNPAGEAEYLPPVVKPETGFNVGLVPLAQTEFGV